MQLLSLIGKTDVVICHSSQRHSRLQTYTHKATENKNKHILIMM